MRRFYALVVLTTMALFMFSAAIIGQNIKQNSEFELTLEGAVPSTQAFLTINELQNNLIIRLLDQDFALSDQESVLKLESDKIIILLLLT